MTTPARILLTGATGFLGAALARALLADGTELAATRRDDSRTDRLGDAAGDLRWFGCDDDALASAVDWLGEGGAIVHAATCYGRHGETWPSIAGANLDFPLRLLSQAKNSVVAFVNIGTVLDPQTNAYALSKQQFVDWGRLAAVAHPKLRFVNVRLEHLYGPGDDPTKFVTQIVRRCLANETEISLTEGRQKRDFIYLDDALAGLHTLISAAQANDLPAGFSEFDLGSGQPVSIHELVETIHRLTNSRSALRFGALPYRPGEVMESAAATGALQALGWSCQTPLESGLDKLIVSERTS